MISNGDHISHFRSNKLIQQLYFVDGSNIWMMCSNMKLFYSGMKKAPSGKFSDKMQWMHLLYCYAETRTYEDSSTKVIVTTCEISQADADICPKQVNANPVSTVEKNPSLAVKKKPLKTLPKKRAHKKGKKGSSRKKDKRSNKGRNNKGRKK